MLELDTRVQFVKGIGPAAAAILAERGVETVEDLLGRLPFRYEDRAHPQPIATLEAGQTACVIAEVRAFGAFRTRRNRLNLFQLTVGEGMATIKCVWFHGQYLAGRFAPGQKVVLYGRVGDSTFGRGGLEMIQPQFEIIEEAEEGEPQQAEMLALESGRIVPVYEAVGRINTRKLRRVIHRMLRELPAELPEALPSRLREELGLMPLREAFEQAHWPSDGAAITALQNFATPAHQRLIFEELFFLELGLELKRRRMRRQPGCAFAIDDRAREAIKRNLPFHPTEAQKRVLGEIVADMRQPWPMRRLLQGDVGSGKTIVAFEAAIIAIESGWQVAMMAPTEILATQHYLSARRTLEKSGYRIVLLTGSMDEASKREARRLIAHGHAQLVIGTHALLEDKVQYAKLGLVIIDEQHRFGVMQRMRLMKKNDAAQPDVLVMTATPIPRTLALTLYGDLDLSVIDALPPGRTPIITKKATALEAEAMWRFVRTSIEQGAQAYVVCPVIEENDEAPEVRAAVKVYDELRKKQLKGLRVALLHGKMSADEKEEVMRQFQAHELDAMVATTVIEVGVDVANASIMVIEHAERFGLAQLHQLRGRVGRGAAQSHCFLSVGGKVTPEAEMRLEAMCESTDGFYIAEKDLELRGPGEFFGARQAGAPALHTANLVRDRRLLELAKQKAQEVVADAGERYDKDELRRMYKHLQARWNRRYGLIEA